MWNSTGRSAISVRPDYMCRAHIRAKVSTGRAVKRFQSGPNGCSDRTLDDGFLAAVRGNHLRQELLAQIDLRLGVVEAVAFVAHDFEPQVVEGAAHVVEAVLRLDDNLVEAVLDRPQLLLLGEGAEEPLAAPVAPRAADPCVENAPAGKLHVVAEPMDQVDE